MIDLDTLAQLLLDGHTVVRIEKGYDNELNPVLKVWRDQLVRNAIVGHLIKKHKSCTRKDGKNGVHYS